MMGKNKFKGNKDTMSLFNFSCFLLVSIVLPLFLNYIQKRTLTFASATPKQNRTKQKQLENSKKV